MNSYDQNNQYQPGGYAPYQGQPNEPMVSPQPQPQYNYQPIYQGSPEYNQPEYKNEPLQSVSYEYMVRKGFIIKTYGILLTQLAITCIFICLSFIPAVKEILRKGMKSPIILIFFIIFLIVTIVILVVFACFREIARRAPINYILLFTYTLCMSFYCLLLCSFFKIEEVISAVILTFGATVGLTIYAAKTTTDYTFCGAFLFAFILIFILTGGLFIWLGLRVLVIAVGVIIYSLYIIYDTQLILGNKTFEYNVDDYCLAALNLYIDIIYMFIYILQLIGGSK